MTDLPLREKIVCVTGAARRVGRAIMLAFAEAGSHVVIHHNNSPAEAEEAAEAARAFGVRALVVRADHSQPEQVAQMFEHIMGFYDRLDVMVNSAASYKKNSLLKISYEEWQDVIGVNLTGPFLCTQHAGRLMVMGGGGSIINIGDNYGLHPSAARPHHSISKAGLIMLTRNAAAALGEYNIRVNCVIPGPVLRGQESAAHWEELAQKLPLRRTGKPEDVGRACVFLAANDFITGAVLHVDGGESI